MVMGWHVDWNAQSEPGTAALYGAGRRYLRPGVDPVRDLIAERLDDPHFAAISEELLKQETLPDKSTQE